MGALETKLATKPKRCVRKGEVLFEGDLPAETAYYVREGVLVVGRSAPNGREVITSVYFPGEVCAGLTVLTHSDYMGTARAPKKCQTVVTPLSRRDLVELIEREPDFYRSLMLTNRDKQVFKDRMLLGMVADSCQQRAAAALLWLHDRAQRQEGNQAPVYLCRQELADLIGSTVETVIRVLSSFRRRGLIEESRETIRLDVGGLKALAMAC